MSEAVAAVKNVTIAADPTDADDASAIVAATTAKSSDETIATVAPNADGGFDITGVAAGTATITFTSRSFTTSIAVTITAAA